MATSRATSSDTATAAGGTANAIGETVVRSHMLKIDDFSATKDLGVGKSIKSSTFHVGGLGWYIECYPCGVNQENAGWVSLFLCLSSVNNKEQQVEATCSFLQLNDDVEDILEYYLDRYMRTYNAETSWRWGYDDLVERANLEPLLEDDCFQIGCDVSIVREFDAAPPPDLHRALSGLVASGMPSRDIKFQVGGDLFTVHRGLPGLAAHVAASPTSTGASSGTVRSISADNDNLAGSYVLMMNGFSITKKMFRPGNSVISERFIVGGHRWHIQLYPSGEKENGDHTGCLAASLNYFDYEVVKVRFEFTLLTLAREIISSTQSCYAFSRRNDQCCCYFPFTMEPQSSLLLGDSFHVKCDVIVIKEITPMRLPDLHRHFGDLLASQLGADVTFEVGGDLVSAHKCVLATRSTAFMAEFFGPGTDSTTVTRVRIDDMEPRVFKALLHFIYTDTTPEIDQEEDKVLMCQGLLVAADRYGMERLKLICADMLCTNVNDVGTAFATLELADKHGCRRLKEACMKFLKGHFAKDAP